MIRQQRLCSAVNVITAAKRQIHMGCGQQAADLYLLIPCSELTDEDVRTAIKNSGGVKGSLLIPEAPFELLVRRAISRLLPSALQCQQFVHAELLRIASQCAPADVSRFPNLQVSLSQHTLQSMLIAHYQERPVLCSVTYDRPLQCYLHKTIMTNLGCTSASQHINVHLDLTRQDKLPVKLFQ